MSLLLLLDEGPLSLATNPNASDQARRCKAWLKALLARGVRVMVPGIADYELRRELIRADRLEGLSRLDSACEELGYLEVNQEVLWHAAQLWAWARNQQIPTAHDKAIDCDVILAAQAQIAARDTGDDVIVVTTNVAHLDRFVPALTWDQITP